MQRYEYKVIPAPVKGEKARGVKGTPGRFAQGLTRTLNEMAREGWDYLRADTLPCEERSGLTGKTVTYQNMLVFRRAVPQALPIFDETTVPGVMTGAAAVGAALTAQAVTQAQQAPQPETRTAEEGAAAGQEEQKEDAQAPEYVPRETGAAAKPHLSTRAPEGKPPRITAFERLADTTGYDSPEPKGKISKG